MDVTLSKFRTSSKYSLLLGLGLFLSSHTHTLSKPLPSPDAGACAPARRACVSSGQRQFNAPPLRLRSGSSLPLHWQPYLTNCISGLLRLQLLDVARFRIYSCLELTGSQLGSISQIILGMLELHAEGPALFANSDMDASAKVC